MTAHALLPATGLEIPEDDIASFVCASQGPAIGRARNGCDVAGMTSEEPQTVATRYMPHADSPVAGTGEDVEIIGVKGDAVNVIIVTNIYTEWLNVIC